MIKIKSLMESSEKKQLEKFQMHLKKMIRVWDSMNGNVQDYKFIKSKLEDAEIALKKLINLT